MTLWLTDDELVELTGYRQRERSKTYRGIAEAMAAQWGTSDEATAAPLK